MLLLVVVMQLYITHSSESDTQAHCIPGLVVGRNDLRFAIKQFSNANLIVLMVYILIILLMELNCYFLRCICYFA